MQVVEIRIKGHIDGDWSNLLAGLKIAHFPDGCTLLTGALRDQAALYGLLSQLSNMGLQPVSLFSHAVSRVEEVTGAQMEKDKHVAGD